MLMPRIWGEDLFDDLFDYPVFREPAAPNYQQKTMDVMKTDVKENENGFELAINLPGYDKKNVNAELKRIPRTKKRMKKESISAGSATTAPVREASTLERT